MTLGFLNPDCRVTRVEHGGPDLDELRRLGLRRSDLTDFSVCTNPFGPSPRVREALREICLEQYPDPEAHGLRAALAEMHAVPRQCILAGNGVSDLIWLTAQAFVRINDRVLVLGPTYGEYTRAALVQGARVILLNAREQDGFIMAAVDVVSQLQRGAPRIVFLCNPNNPTGTAIDPDVIESWARMNPDTLFVVDEAYQRFAPGLGSLVAYKVPNILLLRSMTKDYALAGLRVGYAVGSEKVISALANVRPPWSVNALAQAGAIAALADEAHLQETLAKLATAKAAFMCGLTNLGLTVLPSACHYFLVRVGEARMLRDALLKRGLLVRAGDSFGLPTFVRLATRRPEENGRLLAALNAGVNQAAS